MRLKYQLRGLGIGIILTAALLMIFSDDREVSAKVDEAVVMDGTEADMTEETVGVEDTTVVQIEDAIQEDSFALVEKGASVEEESSTREETNSWKEQTTETTVEEESVLETTEESKEVETITKAELEELPDSADDVVKIKIVSGDDSGTVARKLQTAGLVDNAGEFDAYLMQHGYDKKIAVGEKEIPMDATWLEIAEKISSR